MRPAPLTAWYEARSTDSSPASSRIGASATTAAAVVQFGLAIRLPRALAGRVGVRLGDDQRNVHRQAEGARVVDHQRDRCARAGHDLAALWAVDGQEQDVQLVGICVVEHVDRDRRAAVLDRVPLLVAEGAQALGRQARIGEDGAEDAADDAARAGNADGWPTIHAWDHTREGGTDARA